MANTYTLINSYTVGSGGAADIEFTSVPGTYTDLLLKISARTTRTGTDLQDELFIQFNGNTSSYSTLMLEGDGSTTRSATYSSQTKLLYGAAPTDNSTASTFSNCEYYIPNYTSSNNKSVSYESTAENNGTATLMYLTAGLWANSAAITSIKITAYGTFDQYSTAYLYGIKNS
jgi:hypothetical protein